jgi:hydroxymethylglutaryl-CoA reductase
VAIAAGATGDMIDEVARRMVEEKVVRIDRAEEIVKEQANKQKSGSEKNKP